MVASMSDRSSLPVVGGDVMSSVEERKEVEGETSLFEFDDECEVFPRLLMILCAAKRN